VANTLPAGKRWATTGDPYRPRKPKHEGWAF